MLPSRLIYLGKRLSNAEKKAKVRERMAANEQAAKSDEKTEANAPAISDAELDELLAIVEQEPGKEFSKQISPAQRARALRKLKAHRQDALDRFQAAEEKFTKLRDDSQQDLDRYNVEKNKITAAIDTFKSGELEVNTTKIENLEEHSRRLDIFINRAKANVDYYEMQRVDAHRRHARFKKYYQEIKSAYSLPT